MAKKSKSKNRRITKWILLIILLIFIFLISTAVYWISKNTAFLSGKLKPLDISSNNLNPDNSEIGLYPQKIGSRVLNIPKGFKISEFASDIKGARFFSFSPDDTLYIGSNSSDSIYSLRDTNGDGFSDEKNLIDSKLDTPHSVYYYNNDLYLGEQNSVSVYRNIKPNGSFSKKEILVPNLPSGNKLGGGGHTTRTVVVGPDKKLYVSIGSSCNVCEESDERRATIMRYNLDGTGGEIYASGLRNTVGFTFNEGKMWGLDMGRDQIGDNIPPEEVNIITQGGNYGWPYCYGDKIINPEYKDRKDYCNKNTVAPVLELQAHSAPLGIAFQNSASKTIWPNIYQKGFFAAFHGSWNRTVQTGYKVVWVDTKSSPMKTYNFISGWLDEDGAWGRPVGVGFDSKGNLYISDDKQNLIYKLEYKT